MPKITEFEFDENYYENGLATGKSCYEFYRWIPELTIPLAMTIIDHLGIERGDYILDYGCAKGFLVKAFRMLYRSAWGLDISNYAINHCHPDVKLFCDTKYSIGYPNYFNFIIAKDVFEHIEPGILLHELNWMRSKTDNIFAVIPLGENGVYRSPKNNLDITHIICQNEAWWSEFFVSNNWRIKDFKWRINGIKDSHYEIKDEREKNSHGFYWLQKD